MWVINPAIGCHYTPPGLQLPPQPLRGLLPISLLGEQRHNGCETLNSLPKTVTRQCRDCDLNPGPSAPESSTLTTWLPSHPIKIIIIMYNAQNMPSEKLRAGQKVLSRCTFGRKMLLASASVSIFRNYMTFAYGYFARFNIYFIHCRSESRRCFHDIVVMHTWNKVYPVYSSNAMHPMLQTSQGVDQPISATKVHYQ